jgi:alpha-1,2-mannosyltransferase
MGLRAYLCASEYPAVEQTVKRIGIDVSGNIDGFVKAIGRHEILPFLGAYQRMCYSYFFFKKLVKEYNPDFVLVTGGATLIPERMAEKTIVYVHFPVDLEVSHQCYLNKKLKRIYIKPWMFISSSLDFIKKATVITNSNYTRNAIKKAWGIDSTVIYPPCPQYSFPLEEKVQSIKASKVGHAFANKIQEDKKEEEEDIICSIGRFTPEKNYETIIEVARLLPAKRFELIGSVTPDKASYLNRLIATAPPNVNFNVNVTLEQKAYVLKRSKVLLHSFIGEHFGIALVEAMSAGVIPVTHDSGAAKEDNLIPEQFRYDDLDGAVKSVTKALEQWSLDYAQSLREYAKVFSAQSFRENLRGFISHWINCHINR